MDVVDCVVRNLDGTATSKPFPVKLWTSLCFGVLTGIQTVLKPENGSKVQKLRKYLLEQMVKICWCAKQFGVCLCCRPTDVSGPHQCIFRTHGTTCLAASELAQFIKGFLSRIFAGVVSRFPCRRISRACLGAYCRRVSNNEVDEEVPEYHCHQVQSH
jgi:hypothetical protein